MSWSGESELQGILSAVSKPSQSKILAVSEFAITNARHYKQVVHLIERFIRKSNHAQQQFAGLYMIDAICKASFKKLGAKDRKGDVYSPRFSQHLAEICLLVIEAQADEGKRIVRKLCTAWRDHSAIDTELIDKLMEECGPPNSDDEEPAKPSKRVEEPVAKRQRVEASNVNDPRRNPTLSTPPAPVAASYPPPPVDHSAPHHPHNQHNGHSYDPHYNNWRQPPAPLGMPPGAPMQMPMPPMPPVNQPPTPSNAQLPIPPQPPAPVMSAPSLSVAFADDYSDEEDESEEERAERMRKRIEETKAKLAK